MWKAILKAVVKIAVWAAEHPDQIKDLVDTVADKKKDK